MDPGAFPGVFYRFIMMKSIDYCLSCGKQVPVGLQCKCMQATGEKKSDRYIRLEELGLIGCLNDSGVTSENYKEKIGEHLKEKFKLTDPVIMITTKTEIAPDTQWFIDLVKNPQSSS